MFEITFSQFRQRYFGVGQLLGRDCQEIGQQCRGLGVDLRRIHGRASQVPEVGHHTFVAATLDDIQDGHAQIQIASIVGVGGLEHLEKGLDAFRVKLEQRIDDAVMERRAHAGA